MRLDLSNQSFGSLIVIKPAYVKNTKTYWKCTCSCGHPACKKESIVRSNHLTSGNTSTCGAYGKRRVQDLSEKRFGRLIAKYPLCLINTNQRKISWLCICDCGKESIVSSQSLRNGLTKSCGCYHSELAKTRAIRLPAGESGLNYLIGNYKARSRSKNREFLLTREEFKLLTSSNCHYCKQPPSQKISPSSIGGIGEYIHNGIDRINNEIGYVLSNCVPCCRFCNRAKLDGDYDDFLNWINRLKGIL